MANQWAYLSVTLNFDPRKTGANWYVDMMDGDNTPGTQVGHNAFRVIKDLGAAGWELVSTFTLPGDHRPNLVFKKEIEKKEE